MKKIKSTERTSMNFILNIAVYSEKNDVFIEPREPQRVYQ